MLALFGVLIIVASIILGFIVLIQNPKGGGVSGVLGGMSNQLIGVKSSTDVMEKGTWIFAAVVGILCIVSPAFIPKDGSANSANDDIRKGLNVKPQPAASNKDTTAKMPTVNTVDTSVKK